jgi:methionyl-tRNA formyltransferase
MFILASKSDYCSNWLFEQLKTTNNNWVFISEKNDLVVENLDKITPKKIFFLHWSFIVPKDVYNKYECVNFHTGNLPYGKGGSPIQNQIIDGITQSKINALKMSDDGLDAGPIYCSENITLQGNLYDIWNMMSKVTLKMILNIIDNNIQPIPQEKIQCDVYKRRKDNKIPFENTCELEKIYDFIRMLDEETYPNPFINIGNYKLSFSRASYNGKKILADVVIEKSDN